MSFPPASGALTSDERAHIAAALGDAFPARWATWELSVRGDDARVDDDGNVHLACALAWSSEDGALLGALEEHRALLHVADLVDEPTRARAYFRALAASLPAVAQLRGFQPGDRISDLLPAVSLLEDLSSSTFEQFEEKLTRPPGLDDAPSPEPGLFDNAAPEPVAVDLAQEVELATWPRALWPYIRYARWLTERGDPRGELIAAHARATDPDPRVRRAHERRASHLLAEHARYFLGPFVTDDGGDPLGDEVLFTWDLGFVRRISLHLGLDASGPPPASIIRAALTLPSSRLADTLVLSVAPAAFEIEDRHPLPRWTDVLVASGGHPHLRTIEIGPSPELDESAYVTPVEGPPILDEAEDVEAIRAAFPRAEIIVSGPAD